MQKAPGINGEGRSLIRISLTVIRFLKERISNNIKMCCKIELSNMYQ